jgi:hypothetical protein
MKAICKVVLTTHMTPKSGFGYPLFGS